ncbi:MAG: hypothetical protein ACI8RZ_002685 [Myxococcota bacterium]|jgi:hypothetical protein
MTPSYVEASDIDDALSRKHYKTMCVGLTMKDDSVRQYATERLRAITEAEGIAIADACICENVVDAQFDWDSSIALGLTGEQRDEPTACFASLAADPALQNRMEAITALARIPSPSARKALAGIAASSGPTDQRVRALESVGGMETFRDDMLKVLADDGDEVVRAATATALGGAGKSSPVVRALKDATKDESGVVRAAALVSLKRLIGSSADDALCEAMMKDDSAEVRRSSVGAFQGTRRPSAIACLKERAMTFEEDAAVRETMLKVLKSSPHDDASTILCEAIPFWLRSYVVEDLPDKLPGTDIIKAQNDRDWQKSYECVQSAYRSQRGYSCYARMYVGYWFNELGGSGSIPECPKYPAP